MTSNPVASVTKLELAGVTYSLIFDLEAVAVAEDLTGKPLLTGLRQIDINTPTISLVRNMLFACLHANHPEITLFGVKVLVTRANIWEVWTVVLNAWTAGLAEPDPDNAENPTKAEQS
jgi:hypothetical protein